MKNTRNRVRLTESQLHQVIKESVRKILSEGGHLTWEKGDGIMGTNSKDTWYGVPGSTFVWHGEWSDPEIYFNYRGEQYIINAEDAEESLWYYFKEYCEENNLNQDEHTDDDIYYEFAKNTAEDVLLDLGPYCETYGQD